MEALVVGRPNVGKTLFTVNFARYMGSSEISYPLTDGKGEVRRQRMGLDEARFRRVSHVSHRVVQPCEVQLEVDGFSLKIVDSAGIPEGIHPDLAVRRAIAVTLQALLKAPVILLMMDASMNARRPPPDLGPLDDELVGLSETVGQYVILANKSDQDPNGEGVRRIRQRYPTSRVIALSALTRRGFREVKQYLRDHLSTSS